MTLPPVFPLGGALRRYEWGSPTAIPALLGEPPDGRPAAELWFGAHPGDPSPALDTTLDRLIEADPAALLGAGRADAGDAELPFLVKVLAAARALSIQVHPSRAQAQEGFAREQAAGVPVDAAQRSFKDANHKPELICALGRFEALSGFRPVAETVALFDALAWPELAPLTRRLRGADPLRETVTALLRRPDAALARALTQRLAGVVDGPLRGAAVAAADFPADPGLAIAMLLNLVVLERGQALFVPAGTLHAYLRGLGVEVMASSDNVLRCGLTPKHVDADALLAIADFGEQGEPRVHPVPVPGGNAGDGGAAMLEYPVPVPDFRLLRVTLPADGAAGHTRPSQRAATTVPVPAAAPAIVLGTDGEVTVAAGDARLDLRPGAAAYARPGRRELRLSGRGEALVVTCRDR